MLVRLAPGLLVALAATAILLRSGVTPLALVAYSASFVWSVQIPGMLITRLLRARPSNIVIELALGCMTGVAFLLVGLAVFVRAGVGQYLLLWPTLFIVTILVVKPLRHRVIVRRARQPMSMVTAWCLAAVAMVPLTALAKSHFQLLALPPGSTYWPPDMYWYLGGAAELQRAIPPQVAQVAGLPFNYHWFAHAVMAATSLTSGVSLTTVVARLWAVPISMATVALSVGLGRKLTGRYWPGVLAALLITGQAEIRMASWFRMTGYETQTFGSPSQILGVSVTLYILYFLVDLVRGQRLGMRWVLLAVGLLLSMGAKSSILPTIVCGLALAVFVQLLVPSHRRLLRFSVPALGLSIVSQLIGLTLVGGSSAGAGIQVLAIAGRWGPWERQLGQPPLEHYRDPFLYITDPQVGIWLVIAFLLGFAVASAPIFIAGAQVWKDPAAWLLAGVGFSGWCAMLLLTHTGVSQMYFFRGSVVAWHAFVGWALWTRWAASIRIDGALRTTGIALLGVGTGYLGQLALMSRIAPGETEVAGAVWRQLVIFAVVGLALVLLHRRSGPHTRLLIATAIVSASAFHFSAFGWKTDGDDELERAALAILVVLAGIVAFRSTKSQGVPQLARASLRRISAVAAVMAVALPVWAVISFTPVKPHPYSITSEEYQAAAWLRDNTGRFDVVATNLHTVAKKTTVHGDFRAFWISGFSQRRMLLEGWGYVESTHRQHGNDGLHERYQPYADAALFELNEAAFYSPSAEVFDALRERGVRWLFAHSQAGPVSPEITKYAQPRYSAGPVTIYEIN